MKQLKFNVAGQTMTRTDSQRVVAGSIGQYESLFTFDDSWDGYIATAQYTKNGVTYDENIVNGVAEVSAEALIGSGQFHIHVVGNNPDGKRITVNDLLVPVEPSGWRSISSISAGPVITIWHKVVAMLLFLRGGLTGQILRKKSDAAYDGEWVTLPIDVDAAYRTAAEVDAALDGKAETSHTHDERYYTEAEVNAMLSGKLTIYTRASDIPTASSANVGQIFTWGNPASLIFPILIDYGYIYMCTPKEEGGYYWRNLAQERCDTKQNKPLVFTDVTVSTWAADTTYDDHPYKATVLLTGVTSSMSPYVQYAYADKISGNYIADPESYNGGIYIYSKVNTEITIPLIKLEVYS